MSVSVGEEAMCQGQALDSSSSEWIQGVGNELLEELRTSAGRRKWLREAKRALEAERTTDPARAQAEPADEPA